MNRETCLSSAANIQHGPLLSVKRWLFPLLSHPRFAQALKYFVYGALLVNGGFYVADDIHVFGATLPDNAPWTEVLATFATSIDTVAWIGLVFLLELETYQLAEETLTRWVTAIIRALRYLCYVLIVTATWGYTVETLEYVNPPVVADVTDACDLVGRDTSLQTGAVTYVEVTADNCESLSDSSEFYQVEGEVAYIDDSRLQHLLHMGIVDIVNAVVWIIVVLLIEVEILLQSADRFSSPLLTVTRQSKTLFYLVLIGNGVIWIVNSYPLYAWDAFLWIFGFWAIELNLAEWEIERVEEIQAEQSAS